MPNLQHETPKEFFFKDRLHFIDVCTYLFILPCSHPVIQVNTYKNKTEGNMSITSRKNINSIALMVSVGVAALGSVQALAQDRLVLAVDPPASETNLYWGTTVDVSLFPMILPLVGNDAETGEYDDSGLARSWETNDDFSTWTFYLHEDAEWHFDWGSVTAHDVAHSYELHASSDSVQTGVAQLQGAEVEVIDDHTIKFHFDEPRAGFLFSVALRGAMIVYSKAQYDEEGVEGYVSKPAGSGPFQYVERRDGDRLVMERVENHWQGQDAGFKEIEFRWAPEPATKLAMLRSGDAHISDLPRELQPEAVDAGMEIIGSVNPAVQVTMMFNGLYMKTDDPAKNMDLPWANIKVREAMNRALDREQLIDILYDGRASLLPRYGMDERHEGYAPALAERFESDYGFDPERAMALLGEAGYPDAFNDPVIPITVSVVSGNPEFPILAELMQVYFEQIGLQTRLREVDWSSIAGTGRGREAYFINPIRNAPIRPSDVALVNTFTSGGSPYHGYEDDQIQALIDQLSTQLDPQEREKTIQEAFTYSFDQYTDMPIAGLHIEMTVDPEVVGGWTFPGVTTAGMSHWHLIEPAN